MADIDELLNIQIFVPELGVQKCLTVQLDEAVWDIKRKLLASLQEPLPQSFNYGLFLPPCDGRAGKFLLEDRPIRDYPFHDCVPYLELKYKKRVYKMLKLDEKHLKQLHSKSNLKKFMEHVQALNSEKVDKLCNAGLDPNFHDSQGETPLTLAAGIPNNRDVIVSLVGGGAHIDFRNSEGQTAMHKAAFLSSVENVRCLLELGASPNYRDPLGLTPLYYNMLTADSKADVAEMLLKDAADISVTDMHGNHEIHQACKNGLMQHVEHLLYYGADINAQNINGNTPLHVCSVNNRAECARVLLFRGADSTVVNKQGQTALHVAHIVGNTGVAEIIQNHNPSTAVPYRGTPVYNTKRRLTSLTSTLARRRSVSQSSMCSMSSEYGTPTAVRQASQNMQSPCPSRRSSTMSGTGSEYGTMRRYSPNIVRSPSDGHEVNVPRILVIPRGPKGFGFILRGAKRTDAEVDFEPTPLVPALQFFEGVDMLGMAMKAGLRPGDFLLQINGVDVRTASHDQVVRLIQASGETITLKVITVDASAFSTPRIGNGKMTSRPSRAASHLPPAPPLRHPSTSLSIARGSRYLNQAFFSRFSGEFGEPVMYECGGEASYSHLLPAKSIESLPGCYNVTDDQVRCASVKQRPSASRRISAAELEHLMVRQGQGTSQFQPIPFDQDSLGTVTGMKFTSVADMKRRKQRQVVPLSPQVNCNGLPRSPHTINSQQAQSYALSLKSFNSSPDLQLRVFDSSDEAPTPLPLPESIRRGSSDSQQSSEYSRPFRPASRPKTPPPPPPPIMQSSHYAASQQIVAQVYAPSNVSQTVSFSDSIDQNSMQSSPSTLKKEATSLDSPTSSNALAPPAPPPPPPPPPPCFTATDASQGRSTNPSHSNLTNTARKKTRGRELSAPSRTSMQGISAEALSGVRLKPTTRREQPDGVIIAPPSDFDADLRNALAKRRSKVCHEEDDDNEKAKKVVFSLENQPAATTVSRYGGLSLRESVRENVTNSPKDSIKTQHSPPGFANKKDSGYTSSRTSLEPSECGEEIGANSAVLAQANGDLAKDDNDSDSHFPPPPVEYLNTPVNVDNVLNSNNRVSIISHQLEENYGNSPTTLGSSTLSKKKMNVFRGTQQTVNEHDTMSVTSSLSTLSGESERNNVHTFLRPSRTPPIDYDDEPDSGTGDSDNDSRAAQVSRNNSRVEVNRFNRKEVSQWTVEDVADWLDSLLLSEHRPKFAQHSITGQKLLMRDRALFTQLGVTRIAHRQLIEQSIKSFMDTKK